MTDKNVAYKFPQENVNNIENWISKKKTDKKWFLDPQIKTTSYKKRLSHPNKYLPFLSKNKSQRQMDQGQASARDDKNITETSPKTLPKVAKSQ